MIYLRFHAGHQSRYGVLSGKTVHEITPDYFGPFRKTGKKYSISEVKLLAPCQPTKIVAMGLNYLDHAKELKLPLPLHPLIFLKPPTAVLASGEEIICPPDSKRVDYEAELAVVISKKTRNVKPHNALNHVLGYTCFNDVTARDLQKIDNQWTRSKSFDTFAPVGPWIVDDIDPENLAIEAYLNNKIKQRSNTSELIFKIDEIVSFVSNVMTLMPGDIIATGTPPGVGPMLPGDEIRIKIENIGALTNKAV